MTHSGNEGSDGLWIIDSEGKTVYANNRMAQILRTSTIDMLGKDSLAYAFPEDVPEAQRLFSAKRAGNPTPFRFRLRRADSTAVRVLVQGTPLYNAAGTFVGIVGTFTVTNEDS